MKTIRLLTLSLLALGMRCSAEDITVDQLLPIPASQVDKTLDKIFLRDASIPAAQGALRSMSIGEIVNIPGMFGPGLGSALAKPVGTAGGILVDGVAAVQQFSVNVKNAPFNASGSFLTTTAAIPLAAGSTAVAVADASSFIAGHGINIAGAGAGGINFISSVVSVSGNTITISPATSTAVVTGAAVKHDDTAAIQAAINSLAGTGGSVFIPAGTYHINGQLQEPGVINAKIVMPINTYDDRLFPIRIAIYGENIPVPSSRPTKGRASLLVTDGTSGWMFDSRSGYNEESSGGTAVADCTLNWVSFRNLAFRAPINPTIGIIGGKFAGLFMENITIDTGASPCAGYFPTNIFLKPTNDATAIKTPPNSNAANVVLRNISIFGFGTAIHAQEHADMANIYIAKGINGIKVSTAGHGIYAARIQIEHCTNAITAAGTTSSLMISALGTENISGVLVNDPLSQIKGIIYYAMFGQAISLAGATGMRFENIQSPGGASGSFGAIVAKESTGSQIVADNTGERYTAIILKNNGIAKGFFAHDNTSGSYIQTPVGVSFSIYAEGYEHLRASLNGLEFISGAKIPNLGYTIQVKSGTNGLSGTVTLAAGVATISSTAIDTNTILMLSLVTTGGTPGTSLPLVKVSAGSANITGATTDTSTYNWVAFKKY